MAGKLGANLMPAAGQEFDIDKPRRSCRPPTQAAHLTALLNDLGPPPTLRQAVANRHPILGQQRRVNPRPVALVQATITQLLGQRRGRCTRPGDQHQPCDGAVEASNQVPGKAVQNRFVAARIALARPTRRLENYVKSRVFSDAPRRPSCRVHRLLLEQFGEEVIALVVDNNKRWEVFYRDSMHRLHPQLWKVDNLDGLDAFGPEACRRAANAA
jgi:hypothetical protein